MEHQTHLDSHCTIRLIEKNEIRLARALMEQCFEPYFQPIFFIHPQSTLVAVHNDRILGGINLDIYPVLGGKRLVGYIGWLYIEQESRGLGLGRALVAAALEFLKKAGCTDAGACVEGDNPSSFKQLAHQGFAPLPLGKQIRRFSFGMLKIWKHASRFFDMGYFFWHKDLTGAKDSLDHDPPAAQVLSPSWGPQVRRMASTAAMALAMWMITLWRMRLLPILSSSLPLCFWILWVGFPLLVIGLRTFAMRIAASLAGMPVVYQNWDTANVLGFLLPLAIGWPFPVPGNWYPKGFDWQLAQENRRLGSIALVGTACSILLWAVVRMVARHGLLATLWGMESGLLMAPFDRYLMVMALVDSLGFFYPFCGFNASRIKRMSLPVWMAVSLVAISILILL